MTDYPHTEHCLKGQAQHAAELATFEAAHPAYCRACRGIGYTHWYDRHTGYDDYDACPDCVEKSLCPLCAQPIETVADTDGCESERCPACGWASLTLFFGGDPVPQAPEPFECYCWEREWEQLEKLAHDHDEA